MSAPERFWQKVNKSDGCWLWTAARAGRGYEQGAGYGVFNVGGRLVYAHRFSYELHAGPIPDGLVLDHLCRNTLCVRPDHLEVVSHRTNILRGTGFSARHAAKTRCPRGHAYDRIGAKGERRCSACHREKTRERRRRAVPA